MCVKIYRYAVILFLLLQEFLACTCTELQIEKPKELLRHQQKHRPPFIERKLIDSKISKLESSASEITDPLGSGSLVPEEDESNSYRQQEKARILSNEKFDNGEPETSIEKPTAQIRHSRSRSHFSRQVKLDGSEVSKMTPQDPKVKREQQFNNISDQPEETFEGNDTVQLELEVTNNTDEEFASGLNRTLAQEEAVRKLNKLLKDIHPNVDGGSSSKEAMIRKSANTKQKNDSMNKLRKFITKDRVQLRPQLKENENSSYEYGTIIHTSQNDRSSDEIFGKSATEDYMIYDDNDFRNTSMEHGDYDEATNDVTKRPDRQSVQVDIVTRFLRIIENQHLLGENCTAGTDLNLGEGVVDRYAQEKFRLEANLAVNRANMLTRLWKYAPEVMLSSEYLLHASILSMVEFDEDIFAAGNCYDKLQYRDRWLYCPFAHRLQGQDGVLVKDLAIEYKYLSNSSEWFYIARKNAERVIANNNQFSHGFHTYTHNESMHTDRIEDEILTVKYEDGRWSKPYYDCGGGNIWMLTYTVPFFGYANDTYFFKGTSGIDIDLRRVDIDQCPLRPNSSQLNIFAASDKCKKRTTKCIAISGLGFRRGSYRCECKLGFYYPNTKSTTRYYNGTVIEEEYEKLMLGEESQYAVDGVFECLPCAEGCESCLDGSPCVVSLNWLMRTAILILECCVIACLPVVVLFTWKYGNVKVVRAASPVLLRVIALGAFFIYCTTIVMYPRPNVVTCTVRVWLREIGFSLTYGALMLKTWRISVIFRVRSAKAVKITDMNLLKRLGIIVMIFSVFLGIRTLVAPPVVIVAHTADKLKAYLCRTDWWDHSFTTLEVMFLIWGIRLCIVVRKAPSEFNESRFISMAIYNEFLLSVFLNVSMFFLQSPANPDLLYIIFFCHTQLTVTLLLCLIFGSKAYVVFRGGDKEDSMGKLPGAAGKFVGKSCRTQGTSNQTNSISLQHGNFTEESDGVTEEFRRLYTQLELLKEKNMRLGNRHLVAKIAAMQDAANRAETQVSTIQAISTTMRLNNLSNPSGEEVGSNLRRGDTQDGKNSLDTGSREKCSSGTSVRNGARAKDSIAVERGKNGKSITATVGTTMTTTTTTTTTTTATSTERVLERADSKDVTNKKFLQADDKINNEVISTSPRAATSEEIAEPSVEPRNKDDGVKEKCKNKSGHARTHAIVINLDDKSRFSEEVTV